MLDAFVIDSIPKSRFKQLNPRAKITDFTSEHMVAAPKWIKEGTVQVAEYWKVVLKQRNKIFTEGIQIFEDEMAERGLALSEDRKFLILEGMALPVISERKIETRKVKQYITNGVEILDMTDWLGSRIPIFPMYGKEEYVEEGGSTVRKLRSRARGARA